MIVRLFMTITIITTVTSCSVLDSSLSSRYSTINQTTEEAFNEAILVNIIRASQYRPLNFISMAKIGTSQTASLTNGLPTITIGPHQTATQHQLIFSNNSMQNQANATMDVGVLGTKDFYKGLLTPLSLVDVNLLINQGYSKELIFNLLLKSARLQFFYTKNGDSQIFSGISSFYEGGKIEEYDQYDAAIYLINGAVNAGMTTETRDQCNDRFDSNDKSTTRVTAAGRICFDPVQTKPTDGSVENFFKALVQNNRKIRCGGEWAEERIELKASKDSAACVVRQAKKKNEKVSDKEKGGGKSGETKDIIKQIGELNGRVRAIEGKDNVDGKYISLNNDVVGLKEQLRDDIVNLKTQLDDIKKSEKNADTSSLASSTIIDLDVDISMIERAFELNDAFKRIKLPKAVVDDIVKTAERKLKKLDQKEIGNLISDFKEICKSYEQGKCKKHLEQIIKIKDGNIDLEKIEDVIKNIKHFITDYLAKTELSKLLTAHKIRIQEAFCFKANQPLCFQLKARIDLETRSTYGIFVYLGSLLNLTRHTDIRTAKARTTTYEILSISDGRAEKCFSKTSFDGADYCIPNDAKNTKLSFAILSQLLALKTAPGDLPITPTFRIAP